MWRRWTVLLILWTILLLLPGRAAALEGEAMLRIVSFSVVKAGAVMIHDKTTGEMDTLVRSGVLGFRFLDLKNYPAGVHVLEFRTTEKEEPVLTQEVSLAENVMTTVVVRRGDNDKLDAVVLTTDLENADPSEGHIALRTVHFAPDVGEIEGSIQIGDPGTLSSTDFYLKAFRSGDAFRELSTGGMSEAGLEIIWSIEGSPFPHTFSHEPIPAGTVLTVFFVPDQFWAAFALQEINPESPKVFDFGILTSVDAESPGSATGNLKVLPNPVTSGAELLFDLANPCEVRVEVQDICGRTVVSDALGGHEAGQVRYRIDGRRLMPGWYAVRFRDAATGHVLAAGTATVLR